MENGTAVGRRQDTRKRILESAEDLIAQHGVEGFQLKDVADRVGIRPPSVFAHFKGREDIAIAISERLVTNMLDLMTIRKTEPPEATLRRWVNDLMRHLNNKPAHVRILCRDLAQSGSPNSINDGATDHLREEVESRIQTLLEVGIAAGVFRKVRAGSVMSSFVGAALANLAWNGFDDEGRPTSDVPFEDLCEEVCDLIVSYVVICAA